MEGKEANDCVCHCGVVFSFSIPSLSLLLLYIITELQHRLFSAADFSHPALFSLLD